MKARDWTQKPQWVDSDDLEHTRIDVTILPGAWMKLGPPPPRLRRLLRRYLRRKAS